MDNRDFKKKIVDVSPKLLYQKYLFTYLKSL